MSYRGAPVDREAAQRARYAPAPFGAAQTQPHASHQGAPRESSPVSLSPYAGAQYASAHAGGALMQQPAMYVSQPSSTPQLQTGRQAHAPPTLLMPSAVRAPVSAAQRATPVALSQLMSMHQLQAMTAASAAPAQRPMHAAQPSVALHSAMSMPCPPLPAAIAPPPAEVAAAGHAIDSISVDVIPPMPAQDEYVGVTLAELLNEINPTVGDEMQLQAPQVYKALVDGDRAAPPASRAMMDPAPQIPLPISALSPSAIDPAAFASPTTNSPSVQTSTPASTPSAVSSDAAFFVSTVGHPAANPYHPQPNARAPLSAPPVHGAPAFAATRPKSVSHPAHVRHASQATLLPSAPQPAMMQPPQQTAALQAAAHAPTMPFAGQQQRLQPAGQRSVAATSAQAALAHPQQLTLTQAAYQRSVFRASSIVAPPPCGVVGNMTLVPTHVNTGAASGTRRGGKARRPRSTLKRTKEMTSLTGAAFSAAAAASTAAGEMPAGRMGMAQESATAPGNGASRAAGSAPRRTSAREARTAGWSSAARGRGRAGSAAAAAAGKSATEKAEEEQRKAARAERNRHSAAASRERRKNHIQELERRVAVLSRRNAELQVEQMDKVRQIIRRERELNQENIELKKKVFENKMEISRLSMQLDRIGLAPDHISERKRQILSRPKTWSISDWKGIRPGECGAHCGAHGS